MTCALLRATGSAPHLPPTPQLRSLRGFRRGWWCAIAPSLSRHRQFRLGPSATAQTRRCRSFKAASNAYFLAMLRAGLFGNARILAELRLVGARALISACSHSDRDPNENT